MESIKTFLGANTPKGFTSYVNEIYNPYTDSKVYIIKGTAGSGKSTFMKKVADKFENEGYFTERIYCSSDPLSLDGIKVPGKNLCIVDGTAPHIVEPKFAGVCENILNFCSFLDCNKLLEHKDIIRSLTVENSLYHRKSTVFLSAAGKIHDDMWKSVSNCIKEEKIRSYCTRFISREMPKKKNAPIGKKMRRYVSGITPKGLVFLDDTFKALSLRIIGICDEYSAVSPLIIDAVSDGAIKNGYDVILAACVMNSELNEHLIIPELNLSLITKKREHETSLIPSRLIHTERFLLTDETEKLKNKLSYNKKIYNELLKESIFYLEKAKAVHDELEKYYVEAMDFEKLNMFTEDFLAAII